MALNHVNALQTLMDWDVSLCQRISGLLQRYHLLTRLFQVASRLGDGVFWYLLMLALPLWDTHRGLKASAHMLAVSLVCLLSYRWLKRKTQRPRPFQRHPGVRLAAIPLDAYSFPSGHTLHAVAFTTVALSYYGELAILLLPFTLLVALSRPALGLHYPSDVLAGATLGGSVAGLSLPLVAAL